MSETELERAECFGKVFKVIRGNEQTDHNQHFYVVS